MGTVAHMPRPLALALLVTGLALGVLVPSASAASAPATTWLCRPGIAPDPCSPGQSTTRFSPAGARLGVSALRPASHPKIDCFYVYPTVSDQKRLGGHAGHRPRGALDRALPGRALLAGMPGLRPDVPPVHAAGAHPAPGGPPQRSCVNPRAYADVVQAWRTYLRKYNHGRGVVLIGHSQGTLVLRQVIAKEIDPKPAVRRLLVSALLLGGNVLVRRGEDVGGDFQHIPACRAPRQVGCVVAFSTFDQPVPANAIFGRTTATGMSVLCTNPAALRGGAGVLDPVYPTAPFAPGSTIAAGIALLGVTLPQASTPWLESPGSYSAHCTAGDAHVLMVAPRDGAPLPTPSPDPTWGLHLTDANIALGNLTDLVGEQAAAFVAGQRVG